MNDDDDMADLFSFDADTPDTAISIAESTAPAHSPSRSRAESTDSLLEMLASEGTGPSMVASDAASNSVDQQSQDILDWLDEDEKPIEVSTANERPSTATTATSKDEATGAKSSEEKRGNESDSKPDSKLENTETVSPEGPATVIHLPPVFTSFKEALASEESTTKQIRELYQKSPKPEPIDPKDRPQIYCRMLCSKTLEETKASSLADSFENWSISPELKQPQWILDLANDWAVVISGHSGRSAGDCQAELKRILLYYFKDSLPSATTTTQPVESASAEEASKDPSSDNDSADPLISSVAGILLSTGMPAPAVSVLLTKVLASQLPLLALKPIERWEATLLLHTDFYALATYHVPLLILHLDRYMPGWYWPKLEGNTAKETESATVIGRNLQQQGKLPGSWFLTMWAAAVSLSNQENNPFKVDAVLDIWDKVLLYETKEMIFFLALALLQEFSEDLLLLTDDALSNKFTSSISDSSSSIGTNDLRRNVPEWWSHALALRCRTPDSVLTTLKQSEDKALQEALDIRRERAEAAAEARLKAESEAHNKAQEEKARTARDRLNRARLVAFYRMHAPDKEANIDKIMTSYEGRLSELNSKLLLKYGEGFNPAIGKPSKSPSRMRSLDEANRPSKSTSKILAAMNRGLGVSSKKVAETDARDGTQDQVAVSISPADVLPVICWSKEASASRVRFNRKSQNRQPLKYYLVDARSEEAASQQGKFPTAASLSPEALLDPERIKQHEEMFESLRGAVHIVIMGDGFSALPDLYGQKASSNLAKLTKGDESKTNMCALFFIKKGFPFVSIMDGGFASAHSWLVREGPDFHLSATGVLVDYDPESSLFGQMEKMHNESASEKAHRVVQNLLENSLVSMTKQARNLERIAADQDRAFRLPHFLRLGAQNDELPSSDDSNKIKFKNPFGPRTKSATDAKETSKSTLPADGENPINKTADPRTDENAVTLEKSDSPSAVSSKNNSSDQQPAPAKPQPQNPFGRFRQNATAGQDGPGPNPFKGFGAALNNSVKTGMNTVNKTASALGQRAPSDDENKGVPNVLKRNPFARFGSQQQQASKANVSGQQTIARMNNFGRSTLARMRVSANQNDAKTGKNDDGEVSISFNDTNDIEDPTFPDVERV